MVHPDSQPVSTSESFWQKGFTTLRAVSPRAFYISLWAFILPQIIFEMVFARQTKDLVNLAKDFTRIDGPKDFYILMEAAANYAFMLIPVSVLLWMIHVCGYFSIVKLCQCHATGRPLPGLGESLTAGARFAFSRGLIALFLFGLLFFLVQLILPPAILALLPGIMIPVLIVSGTRGVFSPITHALKMEYGRDYPGGKWPLFFQLMSLGAFFYAGVLLVFFISNQLVTLDSWLNAPRSLWSMTLFDLPITPMYVLSLGFRLVCLSFIVCFLAAVTVTFFSWVRRLPASGVTV